MGVGGSIILEFLQNIFFVDPFYLVPGWVSIFDFFSDRSCWAQCMARRDSYFVGRVDTGWVGFVVCDRVAPS
jgi:hypothetical protein